MPFMPGELYREVYGTYVPRVCVDVVLRHPIKGVAFTLRSIPPAVGWHLPGGIIYKGESFAVAARRHLVREVCAEHGAYAGVLGAVEILDEVMSVTVGRKEEPIHMHNVMVLVLVETSSDFLKAGVGTADIRWFSSLPPEGERHGPHAKFLFEHGLI